MHTLGNKRNCWRISEGHADLRRKELQHRNISFDAAPQCITMNLAKSAIIIIDMQNDFCSANGWLDYIGVDYKAARSPINPLNKLIPVFRKSGVPIIWLNWGNRPDRFNLSPSVLHVYNPNGDDVGLGDSLPENQSRVLEKGSWGASGISELDINDNDIHVDKYRTESTLYNIKQCYGFVSNSESVISSL